MLYFMLTNWTNCFDEVKKYNGISLNENLLKGSDLLSSSIEIVLRFRINQFTIIGNIEQCLSKWIF